MKSSLSVRENTHRREDTVKHTDNTSEVQNTDTIPSTDKYESSAINNDETSSSGSSESTGEEDNVGSDEDEHDQVNLPQGSKDVTRSGTVKETDSTDIHNRLASFFSQLAEQRSQPTKGDEVIEKQSDSDSGFEDEDDDNGQQYIEIDLAMGVLSEEPEGKRFESVELPAHEDDAETSDSDSEPLQKLISVAEAGGETLTGRKTKGKKRGIEELG